MFLYIFKLKRAMVLFFQNENNFEMEVIRKEHFNGPQNGLKMVKHPSLCQETIYTPIERAIL